MSIECGLGIIISAHGTRTGLSHDTGMRRESTAYVRRAAVGAHAGVKVNENDVARHDDTHTAVHLQCT